MLFFCLFLERLGMVLELLNTQVREFPSIDPAGAGSLRRRPRGADFAQD